MSVVDSFSAQPATSFRTTQPRDSLRKRSRGWITRAMLLAIVGTLLYVVWVLSQRYTFQSDLEKAGGTVQFEVVGPQWFKDFAGRDHDWLFGTPVRLSAPKHQRVDDHWVKRLERMTRLQTLSLVNTQITDRGMTSLTSLTDLQDLDLSKTAVGDTGLEQIRGLTKLQILMLSGTQISDEGVACLAQMENLVALDLSGTRVRGAGLRHLANMLQLKWLSLDSTQLDDAGLAQLPALPSLEVLDLGSTKITSAGLRVLKGRRSIQSLSIRDTQVDDGCIEPLSSVGPCYLPEYSRFRFTLAIGGTKITPRGMSVLRGLEIAFEHPARPVSEELRAQRDWAELRSADP
jgi:Leucine-rich repeat (LRR) protein